MDRNFVGSNAADAAETQLAEALTCLTHVVIDGLRHGHFKCSISSSIGKANRRELIIEAGKSHKFTVPEEELRR
jgi:hypothetical protein